MKTKKEFFKFAFWISIAAGPVASTAWSNEHHVSSNTHASSNPHAPVHSDVADHEHGHAHAQEAQAAQSAHAPAVQKTQTPFWMRVATDFMHDFKIKLDQTRNLDEDNEKLRKRVAKLEIEVAELKEVYSQKNETKRAHEIKNQALAEGGAESSRVLASVHSTISSYAKALEYFEKGRYDLTAKFFVDHLEHEHSLSQEKIVESSFLAGVSLYKIHNYKTALVYFTRVKSELKKLNHEQHEQNEHAPNILSFYPRSLGWLALCYGKIKNLPAQEKVVAELIQTFPHSNEARRFSRDVASERHHKHE